MLQLHFHNLENPDFESSDTIEQRFVKFHCANPHVYANLVTMALQLKQRGRKRVGMKMLFESLRWNYMMATTDADSDYKLNNNYTSRYARMIDENEPELSGMFELRELKA